MAQQILNFEDRISAQFDSLSPKQRAIARLILDNRYFASFASAVEIGEKVDASAATVVRLCQVLGYQGLPDLQETIRQDLPSYLTAVERFEKRSGTQALNDELPQRVFANDIANLRHTATVLELSQLRSRCSAVSRCRTSVGRWLRSVRSACPVPGLFT